MNNQPIAFISENGTLFKELPPLPINLIPLYKNSERINIELLKALKLAVKQNQHDMLLTGEELRQCEAAIAKARSEK
ncbi:hypothetical protein [Polynucleobacter sp. AP-RePozz3-80-G7]|uniref:hypothetical protein n=1 Tax=Polynucleobacter sp. AP-RePozz3-80-G7 TaxID=2689105 RepID=UPI001C0B1177|nr:hypothetical protein [Polynucleobacter sp. AP-RePozz3-80-G7]MBU3639981.1 hypothetical protein [Polynucleobacter sp. AP-RePozz3-80-G7]